jgi:cytochrome c
VTGSGPGETSPFRLALVILPVLVIVVAGANLLGLWTASFQQAAPDERLRLPEHRLPDKPAESEGGFDAAVVLALIAGASAEDGASVFRMCRVCHADEKGAPARLGPNLWGIVGRPKAASPGFNYSMALKTMGGAWSYRDLAEYTHNPRKFAPGTSMAFAGLSDNGRMASLIAYLRTLSDNPEPLPR